DPEKPPEASEGCFRIARLRRGRVSTIFAGRKECLRQPSEIRVVLLGQDLLRPRSPPRRSPTRGRGDPPAGTALSVATGIAGKGTGAVRGRHTGDLGAGGTC